MHQSVAKRQEDTVYDFVLTSNWDGFEKY